MLSIAMHALEHPHHCLLQLLQHHALAGYQLVLTQEDLEVTKWKGMYLRVLMRFGSRADITEFARSF